jgi:signal transduction histidine kinase
MSVNHELNRCAVRPELLARALRHDFGGFLQTVYAAVAILQRRLPAEATAEQNILVSLRSQAEVVKHLLDAIHDSFCVPTPVFADVELSELIQNLAAKATARYPELRFDVHTEPTTIVADVNLLTHALVLLLHQACEVAHERVNIRLVSGPSGASLVVADDGPSLPASRAAELMELFTLTRQGKMGLGLAPVRQIAAVHGGQALIDEPPPEGGLRVRLILPRTPPNVPGI